MRAARGPGTTPAPSISGSPFGDDPTTNTGFVMKWIILVIAGLLEVVWAVGLKYTEGFTRTWPSVVTIAAMIASVVLLGIAMKELPVGAAYGIWVGIGAVGAAIMGIMLFGESVSAIKVVSLLLIVAGIAGLKASA